MKKLQTSGQSCHAATLDTRSSSVLEEGAGLVSATIGLFATWYERWQQRRHLGQLDSRLLRDIGLDPIEARREIHKPFWVE